MANVVLACIVFTIILALLDVKAHPVKIGIIVRGRHQQRVQYVHPVHLDIFRIAMAPQNVRYAASVSIAATVTRRVHNVQQEKLH